MPGLDEPFYGKYRAKVSDNKDPEKRGRLKLIIPAVWSLQETEWADPVFGISGIEQGFLGVPEIGAAVWAEFEAGDPLCPIWSGGWYADVPVGSGDDPGVAAEARQTDPTKVVFKWGSNLIEIDRATGSETIRLTSKAGAIIEMKTNGDVLVQDATGSKVEATASKIEINAGSTPVEIEGSEIKLGAAATEALIKGDEFKTLYNKFAVTQYPVHLHNVTAVGAPSGPPLPPNNAPGGITTELSTKVKTE